MRTSPKLSALAIACASAFPTAVWANGTAITIYSTLRPGAVGPELYREGNRGQNIPGYAVVRQERELALKSGRNTVRFTDVAALIDPTTVGFESLTDARGTTVIEQNFQFDLVNTQRLLQKYIDRTIAVDQVRGNGVESFRGTLLSVSGGLTLKADDGSIQILPHNAGVRLPELPGGLISRPTLVWDIAANRGGAHKTRVSYQTGGITWWADYNVTYQEGEHANACKLDIGAWVSIVNQSGATYPDARLKLAILDYQDKKYAEALTKLDALATEMPQRGEVFYFRGYTQLALKKNAQAKADLQQFVKLSPADARVGEVQGLLKKL